MRGRQTGCATPRGVIPHRGEDVSLTKCGFRERALRLEEVLRSLLVL